MISRLAMEDSRLSFEARGALAYILVKPDDWEVNVTDLREAGGIGRDKAYAIIKEWIAAGYCERVEHRAGGRVSGYTYLIYESPLTDLPLPDLPYTAEPLPVNTDHTNKERSTNKENSTNKEKGGEQHRKPSQSTICSDLPPPASPLYEKVCEIVGYNPQTITNSTLSKVLAVCTKFTKAGYTAEDLADWYTETWMQDWRYTRKHSNPSINQLSDEMRKATTHVADDTPDEEYDPAIWDAAIKAFA